MVHGTESGSPTFRGRRSVYSDNETDEDLLGFEDEVHNIVDLVTNKSILPVTAGILADWGAGKSSLLKMVAKSLRARDVVVIEFSPWRIETYDDAKTAFLSAVIEQVADHLPEEPKTPIGKSALQKLAMLRRRVKWMRVTGLAAKHIITLSAPSLDDLDALLRDEEEPEDQPSTESVSRDFRDEFKAMVAGLEGRSVVVLVDDLDRSLPEQVPEVLQAIRLFLSVPGTAFVIATDERVVRDAIRIRYPQASLDAETNLPSEYLEKIIQVPIHIPPVGPAEAESYLNLLVAQTHLAPEQMAMCLAKAKDVRASGSVGVSMNLGLARDAVGAALGDDAEREFALMGRIARPLAVGLKGNPRQLKRYLNAMEMRWNTAVRRNLNLDRSVLAKLMVLEYAEPARYKDLHRWVNDASEMKDGLGRLEATARRSLGVVEPDAPDVATNAADVNGASEPLSPGESPDAGRIAAGTSEALSEKGDSGATPSAKGRSKAAPAPSRGGKASAARDASGLRTVAAPAEERVEPKLPADAHLWTESEWQMEWLALDPPLSGVDLGPYFELGRAALPSLAVRARALPERLQKLLQHMGSSATDVRDKAADQAAALDAVEASLLTDAALDRLASEKMPGNLILAVSTIAASHPSLAPALLRAIRSVPFDVLTPGLPQAMQRRLKDVAAPGGIDEVLRLWSTQTTNSRLAAAARHILDTRT